MVDDTINRQAAIDKINERQRKLIYCFGFENDMVKIMDIAKSIIIAIPSAQPERKKGRWNDIDAETYTWKIRCDQCGHERSMLSTGQTYPRFCENCGSDMRGRQEGEKK